MTNATHVELNNEIMKRREDGFFDLQRDELARDLYLSEVHDRYRFAGVDEVERIKTLVAEGYYYPEVLTQYSDKDIRSIYEAIGAVGHEFKSYMAATKFYAKKSGYALMDDTHEQYLEVYSDRIAIAALEFGAGDIDRAIEYAVRMASGTIQPATPTFMNAGRARRGELVSCFLLSADDSLNSINHTIGTAMQLSKIGGGVAINLSRLRGRGEAIKGVEGAAKGIMPVLKLLEDAFSYADQMG